MPEAVTVMIPNKFVEMVSSSARAWLPRDAAVSATPTPSVVGTTQKIVSLHPRVQRRGHAARHRLQSPEHVPAAMELLAARRTPYTHPTANSEGLKPIRIVAKPRHGVTARMAIRP